MSTQTADPIQLVVSNWRSQNKRVDQLLATFTPEQWQKEIAPGRNRGIYLLGHLTAVNDALLPLFGLGERLFPELEAAFLRNPDRTPGFEFPSVEDLQDKWQTVNATLEGHFAKMTAEHWLGRHTAVSEADFANEPHRNKLNVLLNRTVHQGFHLGQLELLK